MTLLDSLHTIPDCRRKQGQRYPLVAILLITILSIMCGRCRYREIAVFVKANQTIFLAFFQLNRPRLASHVTFRAILKGVDFDEVNAAFPLWASQDVTITPREWMAVDGKALASTVTEYDSAYQNFVSLVSVFSHTRGQVLRVARCENQKSSEIPAVKALLETCGLHEVILTLDALHCQKTTVEAILANVIQVKGNQPGLLQRLQTTVESELPLDSIEQEERSRGRKERRKVTVFPAPRAETDAWKGLHRVLYAERETTRDEVTSYAEHYYISSVDADQADLFATGIRGHWSIENRLHWVKDVIQHEDDSGIRHGNGIDTLSLFKNVAINMSRELGFDSLKEANIHFASNVKELLDHFRT